MDALAAKIMAIPDVAVRAEWRRKPIIFHSRRLLVNHARLPVARKPREFLQMHLSHTLSMSMLDE